MWHFQSSQLESQVIRSGGDGSMEHVRHMLEPLNRCFGVQHIRWKWQQEIKTQSCFIPNILNWQMSACLRKLDIVKTFSYYTNKLHWMGNIWGWCCSQDVELHYQVCVCRSAPPTQRTSERCSVLPSMTGLYWREAPSNGQRFTEVRCLLTTRRSILSCLNTCFSVSANLKHWWSYCSALLPWCLLKVLLGIHSTWIYTSAAFLTPWSNEASSFQAQTNVNSAVWPWVTTFTTILVACLTAHPATRSLEVCVSTGAAWWVLIGSDFNRTRLEVRLYLVRRHKNLKKDGMVSHFVRDVSLFFSVDIKGLTGILLCSWLLVEPWWDKAECVSPFVS